jgi:cytochrome P450 / NADPH-cytochrome P450 reductase
MASSELVEIPQPPAKPFIGNLLSFDRSGPVQGLVRLAQLYGPIYRLAIRGTYLVVISDHALVNEVCDESRFDKSIAGALSKVRQFGGDGLFTAETTEPTWAKAHHILLPNFSQRAMRSYHEMMIDVAGQLVAKWARLNPDDEINVARDMTALTLDTIGLCGFAYRFNSFYRDTAHPFVEAMVDALEGAMQQIRRLPGEGLLRIRRDRRFARDIEYMNGMVDRLVGERRAAGADLTHHLDLLNYMLAGIDKKTGGRLDDTNIRYQIITFLIAGHETTSGMLAFAINALLHNPAALARANDEVDRVLGPDPRVLPTFEQVSQLGYLGQILKETLRLWPTAPAFALRPLADTVLGGKYAIKKNHQVMVLLPALHRDPSVWGPHPEVFNPDNFVPAAERRLPPGAYKPFGNGQRSCIGRQFAMQEATLVLAMVLHRFTLIDHTGYRLKLKETLTMKPEGFTIKVRPRTDDRKAAPQAASTLGPGGESTVREADRTRGATAAAPRHGTPLLVLYGSNLGAAEDLALQIAREGEAQGYAVASGALDEFVGELPGDGAVIIVTASYNGTPPDNAATFCKWLTNGGLAAEALGGVNYSVFGCGNRDWAATFQAIPRLLDEQLAAHGAHRLCPRGEGDARGDFDAQFQNWYRPLWSTLAGHFGIKADATAGAREPSYRIEILSDGPLDALARSTGARAMRVLVNRELHRKDGPHPSERSTRHLELEIPAAVEYRTGDHLGVIPHNSDGLVRRVARRFGFADDVRIRLHQRTERKTPLPLEQPIAVTAILRDYLELQAPATRGQIEELARRTACPPERTRLLALVGDDEVSAARYRDEVLLARRAVIDLLEECPSCTLSFGDFLEMLQPLAPRYYSISSSPLVDRRCCSVTVAVLNGPARSGHGDYHGACSNYLAGCEAGRVVAAFIRDNHSRFRLPDDPAIPLIMVGPGTGLAPFRGFLQERAALKTAGRTLGPAMLFFGCRHPDQDFIYEDELRACEASGVCELYVAFSRYDPAQRVYVQQLIRDRADKVMALLDRGARVYVCGDASRMAPDVRSAFAEVYACRQHVSPEAGARRIDGLAAQGRYLVDVWSTA